MRELATAQAQKEPSKQQAGEVLGNSCQSADNGPQHHSRSHVSTWAGPRQEHIGRDLSQQISDEKDRYTGLVLGAGEIEVFLKIIDPGKGNRVSVQVIELTG